MSKLPPKKNLGRLLKTKRRELGLTQRELAERSGVSYVTISKMEGGYLGSDDTLKKLAEALGLDVHLVMDKAHGESQSHVAQEEGVPHKASHQFFGRSQHTQGNRLNIENKYVQLIAELPRLENQFEIEWYLSLKLEDGTCVSFMLNAESVFDWLSVGIGTDPRTENRGFIVAYSRGVDAPYLVQLDKTKLFLTAPEMKAFCDTVDDFCRVLKKRFSELEREHDCRGYTRSRTGGWRIFQIPYDWWRFLFEIGHLPPIEGFSVELSDDHFTVIELSGSPKKRGVYTIERSFDRLRHPKVWFAFKPDETSPWMINHAKLWFRQTFLTYVIRLMIKPRNPKPWEKLFDFITKSNDAETLIEDSTHESIIPEIGTNLVEIAEETQCFFYHRHTKVFSFSVQQVRDLQAAVITLEELAAKQKIYFHEKKPDEEALFDIYQQDRSGLFVVSGYNLDQLFRCLFVGLRELKKPPTKSVSHELQEAMKPFWSYVEEHHIWERFRLQFVGPKGEEA